MTKYGERKTPDLREAVVRARVRDASVMAI